MADQVIELATDLQDPSLDKGKDFVAYSLAVDDSNDSTDTELNQCIIRPLERTFSNK